MRAPASSGRAKKKPWPTSQPSAAQAVDLADRLDPLRDDREPERMGEADDPAEHRRAVPVAADPADERAVDRDDVDRELLERRERGRPGAEVVDREGQPEPAELLEHREVRLVVAEHGGLGHLQAQPGRIDPGPVDGAAHDAQEVGLRALAGGEVHGDAQRRAVTGVGPARGLPAGLLDDPRAERRDQAALLRERQELRR